MHPRSRHSHTNRIRIAARDLLRFKTGLRSDSRGTEKQSPPSGLLASFYGVSVSREVAASCRATILTAPTYRFLTTSRGFRKKQRWISSNSSPFCDVNIIKRPPAYLCAARKRPLQGGPIHAHTYDPQEAEAFREGKRNLEEGKNYRSCPQWRRPNFTPQKSSRGPSSLSSSLLVSSFHGNHQH